MTHTETDSRRGTVAALAAGLSPSYFAMVMATGIVSIACKLARIPLVPEVLLAVNVLTYPTHITALPVGINIQCHSARLKEAVF